MNDPRDDIAKGEAARAAVGKRDPFEIVDDYSKLLEDLKLARDVARQAKAEMTSARQLNERLGVELASKTAELRRLQDERDPTVLDRVRSEAYARGVRESSQSLAAAHSTVATLRNENTELRASKKKLREALDRAKAGR